MIGLLHAATLVTLQLQTGPEPLPGPGVNPVVGVVSTAVGTFVVTLVVGGIMVTVAPRYTERTMDRLREEPGGSFLYGILAFLLVLVVTVVLVITIVGILLAIPLIILAVVVWAVGSAVAFLTIGERLVGRGDGWLKPLVVGAAVDGALALTGIGGLVSFAVGAAGFGAILRDWRD